MKKTLLALLFVTSLSQAQIPINTYMGELLSDPTLAIDGINLRTYDLVAATGAIDESGTGTAQTWNFNLDVIGAVSYGLTVPTAQELNTYPTSTSVLTMMTGSQVAQFFMSGNGSNIVGVANPEFTLTYTNAANIGTFPLAATHSNNDTVAGSFEYDGNIGTFTGTFNTSVDASGTLMTYAFSEPREATRLKTIQNLTLTHPIFGNVGSFTQTIYHYYDHDVVTFRWPQFRSTTTTINVPLLGINETQAVYEMQIQGFLQTPEVAQAKTVLYPNPANDVLNIQTDATVESIAISDLAGKTVLAKQNPGVNIDVSQLTSGVYIVNVKSDKGNTIKKLIKN